MVMVEYVAVSGPGDGVFFVLIVVGIILFLMGLVLVVFNVIRDERSPALSTIGVSLFALGFATTVISPVFEPHRSIPQEQRVEIAEQMSEETCMIVTEADVLLMYRGRTSDVEFEYDTLREDGKTYFLVQGEC